MNARAAARGIELASVVRSGLVAAWLVVFALPGRAPAQANFLRGDANGDGAVTISDPHYELNYLFRTGELPECPSAGDVDASGSLDITDSVFSLNFLFLGGAAPCTPFPVAGQGPEGGLPCASYGGGQPVMDPAAEMEVSAGAVGQDGRVTFTIIVSSSRDLGGYSGVIGAGGDVRFGAGSARPVDLSGVRGEERPDFMAARVIDGRVRFGALASLTEAIWFPPGDRVAVLEFTVCLAAGTAPGVHPVTLEFAELSDAASGQAIPPMQVGASLTVPPGFQGASNCGSAADGGGAMAAPPLDCSQTPDPPPPPPPPPDPGPSADFARGDANADGRVSMGDSLALRRYLFNGDRTPSCFDAADLTDDGGLDITDVVFGLNALFLDGAPPPAPLGDAGPDPTLDGLGCLSYVPVPAATTADIVEIDTVEAAPGERVEVPVYLTNAVEVEAYQLVVRYDPSVFTPAPGRLALEGSFYGPSRVALPNSFQRVSTLAGEEYLTVGFIPDLIETGFETPPGEHRLVFKIPGSVHPAAPDGAEVVLEPTNGPDGAGIGPFGLRNELVYRGEARYVTAVPQTVAGMIRIVGDVTIFRGDANGDDTVNMTDAVYTLNALFLGGPALACPDAADADDSGGINITDAVATLNTLFLGGRGIAPPYPGRGRDPTPDGLARCSRG